MEKYSTSKQVVFMGPADASGRQKLKSDLQAVGQAGKVLAAFDVFLEAKKEHEKMFSLPGELELLLY